MIAANPLRRLRDAAALSVSMALACVAPRPAPSPLPVDAKLAPAGFDVRLSVLDTVSSLGPLSTEPRELGLSELVAWHGHACDGLVACAIGLAHGLQRLFAGAPVDRTDLCVATNRSACYGDVAMFFTGARHRYGSLAIDSSLGDEWILHRRSTNQTVRIRLRSGVKPRELPALEAELRAADCPSALLERVRSMQDEFTQALLLRPAEELFEVEWLPSYPYPLGERRPDTLKRDCSSDE